MKRTFFICDPHDLDTALELELDGWDVYAANYSAPLDLDEHASMLEHDLAVLRNRDAVHIIYNPLSEVTNFFLGAALALGKPVYFLDYTPIANQCSNPKFRGLLLHNMMENDPRNYGGA